jgi:hypothetical protein
LVVYLEAYEDGADRTSPAPVALRLAGWFDGRRRAVLSAVRVAPDADGLHHSSTPCAARSATRLPVVLTCRHCGPRPAAPALSTARWPEVTGTATVQEIVQRCLTV